MTYRSTKQYIKKNGEVRFITRTRKTREELALDTIKAINELTFPFAMIGMALAFSKIACDDEINYDKIVEKNRKENEKVLEEDLDED